VTLYQRSKSNSIKAIPWMFVIFTFVDFVCSRAPDQIYVAIILWYALQKFITSFCKVETILLGYIMVIRNFFARKPKPNTPHYKNAKLIKLLSTSIFTLMMIIIFCYKHWYWLQNTGWAELCESYIIVIKIIELKMLTFHTRYIFGVWKW